MFSGRKLVCLAKPLQGAWEEERARRRRVPAVWQLIRDNVLTHRKRKVQEEDDVMICQCKPVWRGGDGCGPDCINRMLCIECVSVSAI
jgi:histone-lysine N-methyltransferase SETD2